MTIPIKPSEVKSFKSNQVIEAFNELIQKYWDGSEAKFTQDEAVKLIAEKMKKSVAYLFENHYLDVEELYRKEGWQVNYDKPGFNESYLPTFTFFKK